jgi:hypothetical protein
LALYRLLLCLSSAHLLMPDHPAVLLRLHFSLHLYLVFMHEFLFALPDDLLVHITTTDDHLVACISPERHPFFRTHSFFVLLLGLCR